MSAEREESGLKQPIHKEIFICSCRKQYESFPALYLHNKTKHNIAIRKRDKVKMRKKSIWSGNKKKMIYEFSSEAELDSSSSRQTKPKAAICTGQAFKGRNQKPKTQQEQLRGLFNQFIQSNSSQTTDPEFRKELNEVCSRLATYVCQKNIQFSVEFSEVPASQFKTKIQILPYFLNSFALHQIPSLRLTSMAATQVLVCLHQISYWMFEKKHSSYLAVLTGQNGAH